MDCGPGLLNDKFKEAVSSVKRCVVIIACEYFRLSTPFVARDVTAVTLGYLLISEFH